MRRGDIYWALLDPMVGAESNKRRPVILVSNQAHLNVTAELGRGVVTIVPVTSNVDRVLSFQVALSRAESGLAKASKAQAEQIRSIDYARLDGQAGRLSRAKIRELDDALRLHLNL